VRNILSTANIAGNKLHCINKVLKFQLASATPNTYTLTKHASLLSGEFKFQLGGATPKYICTSLTSPKRSDPTSRIDHYDLLSSICFHSSVLCHESFVHPFGAHWSHPSAFLTYAIFTLQILKQKLLLAILLSCTS
jgi:hypothetical protein